MYWSCASLGRVELALHFLEISGYATYTPRVRVERKSGGPDGTALLFPGYTFISIELQWHRASRTPGVAKLIMDGEHPGRVPDRVIEGYAAVSMTGSSCCHRLQACGTATGCASSLGRSWAGSRSSRA